MEWSWLPPATFGVVVTLVVTWVQDCLQQRRRRSGERRARMEERFQEVRAYLLRVGQLAHEVSEVRRWEQWVAQGAEGADARQQWLEELERKREETYASPLAVATGLFVQDERLLGKLSTTLELMDELFRRALAHAQGGPAEDVSKVKAALGGRMGEAQELMDRMVDEL